ncbi:hypothetical protein BDW62DRAFT_206668 [Aspergillus aurantiobrunneus]
MDYQLDLEVALTPKATTTDTDPETKTTNDPLPKTSRGFYEAPDGSLHWITGKVVEVISIDKLVWVLHCRSCGELDPWEPAKFTDIEKLQRRLDPGAGPPAVGDHAYGFRRKKHGVVVLGMGLVARVDEGIAFYKVERIPEGEGVPDEEVYGEV